MDACVFYVCVRGSLEHYNPSVTYYLLVGVSLGLAEGFRLVCGWSPTATAPELAGRTSGACTPPSSFSTRAPSPAAFQPLKPLILRQRQRPIELLQQLQKQVMLCCTKYKFVWFLMSRLYITIYRTIYRHHPTLLQREKMNCSRNNTNLSLSFERRIRERFAEWPPQT